MDLFKTIIEKENGYLIKGFPHVAFMSKLKNYYRTTKLKYLMSGIGIRFQGKQHVLVHKFFIPELIFLLEKFGYSKKLINNIIENTWLSNVHRTDIPSRINMKLIKAKMQLTLKTYQTEFVENYDIMRQRYQLNGYLLSLDQGMGKTLTALSTMVALNKKKVIILAPKSVLETVWLDHIQRFFKKNQKVFVVNTGQSLDMSYDYYILNYASMEKINEIVPRLSEKPDDVGIIVDESHNFLRVKSDRTIALINLRKSLFCTDILLMSGTPLKAVGAEMMPILMVLDPYFDDEALKIFKKSFGVNTNIANDVLNARLSVMMHRKLKTDELDLPPKNEYVKKVVLPHGDIYTISKVKEGAKLFANERLKFHHDNMDHYMKEFREVMEYVRVHTKLGSTEDFMRYLTEVNEFHKEPVDMRDPDVVERIAWVNLYERKVLIPELSNEMKKKFKGCKSAVKYVHLKVRGEVIGQFLTKLRMQMTSEMVEHANLKELIDSAIKKTVIFTSYVDTVNNTGEYLKKHGYNPMVLHGNTKDDAKSAVQKFKKDPDLNPMVSSITMLMTGVTITEANRMIFMNKPYRFTDYMQASDRIHRIGQDTVVDIYTILLDTGDKANLSTRMEEIMDWSKDQFSELVDA